MATPDGSSGVISVSSASLEGLDVDMQEAKLPDDLIEAICLIDQRVGTKYPEHRPTGLVDATLMSQRVDECLETLRVATITSGLSEHVNNLKTGLDRYSNAVNIVADHLKTISDSARDDLESVSEKYLLNNFGIPASHGKLCRLGCFILFPRRFDS